MTKKAFLSLVLAIMLPLGGYWIMKYLSKDAVHMPPHYFYDSVVIKNQKGKSTPDTLWHSVKNMSFTNQLGKKVSLDDARGKILVINYFFTRCPVVCPTLTTAMKRLQASFKKNAEIVQFISISVDPEHDSVANLRKYADRFNVNHDSWWMVTGDKKEIYDFAIKEMKANIADPKIDTAFIHTEDFFLLDSNRVIRGWYSGYDSVKQSQLARDIPTLMLEKDRKSPSILRGFIPYLPVIFIGIAMVIFLVTFLSRNKKI
ncbi:MAG: SCO family protein [Ferruginibacter sp.]